LLSNIYNILLLFFNIWASVVIGKGNGTPPGSPIPGILQARTLEWVAISFSNA